MPANHEREMFRTLDSSARDRLLNQLTLKLWLAANSLCGRGAGLLTWGNLLFFVQLFRIFYSFIFTCPSCCLCCLRVTLKESDRNLRFTTPFSIFFFCLPPAHFIPLQHAARAPRRKARDKKWHDGAENNCKYKDDGLLSRRGNKWPERPPRPQMLLEVVIWVVHRSFAKKKGPLAQVRVQWWPSARGNSSIKYCHNKLHNLITNSFFV